MAQNEMSDATPSLAIGRALEWIERDLCGKYARSGDQIFFGNICHRGLKSLGPDGQVAALIDECSCVVKFYTNTNEYRVHIKSRSDGTGGMFASSSSRKRRAGEDWVRGNDLADGPLTEETWRKIVRDVLSCELVDITPHGRESLARKDRERLRHDTDAPAVMPDKEETPNTIRR